MFFGSLPLAEAEGAILVHAVRQGDLVFKKGRVLTREDCVALLAAGVSTIIGARMEPDDVAEDEAARRAASLLEGDNISSDVAQTGRGNLLSEESSIICN